MFFKKGPFVVVTETNCTVRSEKNHFYAMRDYISIKKSSLGFTETREMIGARGGQFVSVAI